MSSWSDVSAIGRGVDDMTGGPPYVGSPFRSLAPLARGAFFVLPRQLASEVVGGVAVRGTCPGPAFYHTGKRCARDEALRWSKGCLWPRRTNVWRKATSPARGARGKTSICQ